MVGWHTRLCAASEQPLRIHIAGRRVSYDHPPMLLSPRHSSTLADVLRLLAVWLALVVGLQGFAAVHARAAGPSHQHHNAGAANLLAHRHHHDEMQRHLHAVAGAAADAVDPASVMTQAETAALDQALDAAAAALAAAFLLLATVNAVRAGGCTGRDWRAARAWALCTAPLLALLKPPQRG
jgi:hypothetical protein